MGHETCIIVDWAESPSGGIEESELRVCQRWPCEKSPSCQRLLKHMCDIPDNIHEDITQRVSRTLPSDVGVHVSSPPCPPWVHGRKRQRLNCEEGRLWQNVIGTVEIVKPNNFIIENLAGMVDEQPRPICDAILQSLEQAGRNYAIHWRLSRSVLGSALPLCPWVPWAKLLNPPIAHMQNGSPCTLHGIYRFKANVRNSMRALGTLPFDVVCSTHAAAEMAMCKMENACKLRIWFDDDKSCPTTKLIDVQPTYQCTVFPTLPSRRKCGINMFQNQHL